MNDNTTSCPVSISVHGCEIVPRNGHVRDFQEVGILECMTCGVTFHDTDLSHVVDSQGGSMNSGGTQESIRTVAPDNDDSRRGNYIRTHFPPTDEIKVRVLDFGSGNGNLLTELRAQYEVEGLEIDLNARLICQSLGFRIHESLEAIEAMQSKFDVITMIHVIEHLSNPLDVLKRLARLLTDKGSLIIETPNSDDALLTFYNCEAFQNWTYWSHHPLLFNFQGVSNLLERANLKLISSVSVQRYNLANHLYWLSQGIPGGHVRWGEHFSDQLNQLYQDQLFVRKQSDTIFVRVSN